MVASLRYHLEHHELSGAKEILHGGQRDIPKKCPVPGSGKISSPQSPKG